MNDYTSVARLYDAYVRVDFDLAFFAEEAVAARGPVLELTAGTGRVSAAVLGSVTELTCVDISLAMLQVLREKLAATGGARIVCADMRRLPLKGGYALALIPANAFSELTDRYDQRRALEEAHRVLVPDGRLVLTLHNPAIRAKMMDGRRRLLGSYVLPETGGQVEFYVQEFLDPESGVAEGLQTYRIYDEAGTLQGEQEQRLRFSLIGRVPLESMALSAGFAIEELFGDYDRSAFDPGSSRFMIWTLRSRGNHAAGRLAQGE